MNANIAFDHNFFKGVFVMRVRNAFFIACMVLSILAPSAIAAENWALGFDHHSICGLLGGKTVYETAFFERYVFWFNDTIDPQGAPQQPAGTPAGSLTLKGGTYWAGGEEVQGEEKTFQLSSFDHEPTNNPKGNYYPSQSGDRVDFWPLSSEDGLRDTDVEWTLFGVNRTSKVPHFLTTLEQEDNAVPYIELNLSGGNVTGFRWRLIDPREPSKAISLPCRSQVIFWRFGQGFGYSEYYRPGQAFAAGALLEGTEDFGFNVPLNDFRVRFRLVREDMKKTDGQGLVSKGTYAWDFFEAEWTHQYGFEDKGDLAAPIALKVGETKTIKFTLKPGLDVTLKTLIADRTVVNRTGSWTGQNGVFTFQIMGLKAGKTTLSVPYYDGEGIYLSRPIEVTVTGEGSTPMPKPTPTPKPMPKPTPTPKPSPNEVFAPIDPQRWEIVSETPDEQGNTPVTVTVSITTQKSLVSVRAESTGLIGAPSVEVLRNRAYSVSSRTASSAPGATIVRMTGKVAKGAWNNAAIKALRYRLEEGTEEKELKLGKNGMGILLREMNNQSLPLPEPDPRARTNSGGSGCDGGSVVSGLLLLLPFSLRRKH
ncbi:hypothetical protein [Fretibacterium sp. OH1220_COT-178]|uniref:hypothetical protein n=1 Tax=Fretibacterium sp. OH1220_COT-178 TaxID=2491047 RepID=UPI000F5FA5E7|nr:hypothetical protein [Fretibacterium sp. OH1220_COT-178]